MSRFYGTKKSISVSTEAVIKRNAEDKALRDRK
jgi:hypothetical protein